MILGSTLLRYLLTSGGLLMVTLALVAWRSARPRRRGPKIALALGLLTYLALSNEALAQRGAAWLAQPFGELTRRDVPPGRTAVVILGSSAFTFTDWNNNRYSVLDLMATERTLEGARVARLLNADWVIASGGHPDPADPDEPSGTVIRKTLLQLGIPDTRILVETESQTTHDEAVIVGRMLKTIGAEHTVLVTSAVHMRRSLGVFRAAGIDAIPAIARVTSHASRSLFRYLPTQAGLDLSELVVHESVGLLYYRLRGWQAK